MTTEGKRRERKATDGNRRKATEHKRRQ
jgi:hypothetical protein